VPGGTGLVGVDPQRTTRFGRRSPEGACVRRTRLIRGTRIVFLTICTRLVGSPGCVWYGHICAELMSSQAFHVLDGSLSAVCTKWRGDGLPAWTRVDRRSWFVRRRRHVSAKHRTSNHTPRDREQWRLQFPALFYGLRDFLPSSTQPPIPRAGSEALRVPEHCQLDHIDESTRCKTIPLVAQHSITAVCRSGASWSKVLSFHDGVESVDCAGLQHGEAMNEEDTIACLCRTG